jgi:hypothetical protein
MNIFDLIVIALLSCVAIINFFVYVQIGVNKDMSGEWRRLAEWHLEILEQITKRK